MTNHEQTHAYYQGLREGMDTSAEDLGIPMSPETLESHIASGKAVAERMAAVAVAHEVSTEYQGGNQKGGLDHIAWAKLSPDQRLINQRGVQQTREALTANTTPESTEE